MSKLQLAEYIFRWVTVIFCAMCVVALGMGIYVSGCAHAVLDCLR